MKQGTEGSLVIVSVLGLKSKGITQEMKKGEKLSCSLEESQVMDGNVGAPWSL